MVTNLFFSSRLCVVRLNRKREREREKEREREREREEREREENGYVVVQKQQTNYYSYIVIDRLHNYNLKCYNTKSTAYQLF